MMYTVKIRENNKKIYELLKEIKKPTIIKSKKESAVLLPMEEWKAIQETLYLCSIPGMRNSIISGMKENLQDCSTKIEF